MVQLTAPYHVYHAQPPVAVLTNNRTASSGEITAIAFRGRPLSRSFGLPTAGYATANDGHTMSDGAVVVLTAGYVADRTGKVYDETPIAPDEIVYVGSDPQQAAVDWLRQQTACSVAA